MTSPTAKICVLRSAVIRVYFDAPAVVGFDSRRCQIQPVDVALAPHRVEQRVAHESVCC